MDMDDIKIAVTAAVRNRVGAQVLNITKIGTDAVVRWARTFPAISEVAEEEAVYGTHRASIRMEGGKVRVDLFWGHYDLTQGESVIDYTKRCRDLRVSRTEMQCSS